VGKNFHRSAGGKDKEVRPLSPPLKGQGKGRDLASRPRQGGGTKVQGGSGKTGKKDDYLEKEKGGKCNRLDEGRGEGK